MTVIAFSLQSTFTNAQDTFSIVAVDSLTGEIGSAGASCLDERAVGTGVIVISDVKPSRGAINSQVLLDFTNQRNAGIRMNAGNSPQEIIDWLVNNDVQNDPSIRQYGIVDFAPDGRPRAAAFTGQNCFDYKGQRVGNYYAIQGNILSGAAILDSMEARFLRTEGSLADRLMAAMQGANVRGADTRCFNEGVSSLSAYIQVAKTDDNPNNLWLEIDVPSTPFGIEPIDVLQERFDEWKNTISMTSTVVTPKFSVYPNPTLSDLLIQLPPQLSQQSSTVSIFNNVGKLIYRQDFESRSVIKIERHLISQEGIYMLQLVNTEGTTLGTRKIIVSK